ncbi:MAG TPA: hypothetical protein VNZ52_11325 [Candidatus Thermoplasmatota archaeon]|nr:hypothetical protein [Candidatus Thermoplasmatota archaeon]
MPNLTLLALALLVALPLSLAGCLGGTEELPPSGPQEAPVENEAPAPENGTTPPRVENLTAEGSTLVGTPLLVYGPPGAFDVAAGVIGNASLTATWTPSSPLAASLLVELRDASDAVVASAEGQSPLMMAVPPESLVAGGSFRAVAFPGVPGAMVNEKLSYVLTLEYLE